MKRLLALLLTLVLVMSLFVACDNKKRDKDDDDDTTAATTEGTNVATDKVPAEPSVTEPDPTEPNTDAPVVNTPVTGTLDGTWICEIDGADFIGDEYAGITITMTFIANGDTCSLTTEVMGQGDTMNGTVSADKKTVTFDGEDLTATINGNTLSLTDSTGEAMVFTKSGSGSVVTPTPDSKSELDGTWTCEIDGADFIGDEYAGITITMTFIANGDTCSLTTEVMGQGDTMNGTVSADKKTVTFDGEDLTVAISGNTLTLTDSTGEAMVFTK